ncbi:aldehyde dehydrogenase family protein [Pseudomonas aeruginosa]|nr:aldehyde dehydrogenase family protein [Pseudomonas aeruginosa]
MRYAHPGSEGAIVSFKARYGNYIGGEFVPPVKGQYFTNTSPVNGQPIAEFPRSTAEDIDKALDAAHAAADAWGRTSVQERSNILLKIADRIEQNLELLAVTETWDNGKAVRETLNADIPLAADHFRYFAGCIRAQEGSAAEINDRTVAYHIHEPLGVVGQIIPWNFPLLMAAWKLAPALAAGNCVVLKPAEQTPLGICVLLELIGDLLPPGVLNVVQGFGREAGEALATSKRIAKIAFTGSTPVGSHILKCAAENIIPSTVELGGKSPNIYFEDIMQAEPAFIEKAAEGLVLAFFNQGEVCTCPSRALVQESIYPAFMEEVLKKVRAIKRGDPLDTETMVGAQASQQQYEKILSYLDIAQQEGAELLAGGSVEKLEGNLASGYYIQPTLLKGHNGMRVFQEEIFGPVVGVTTFKDEAEALAIANDTEYGLGAGLWTRDINRAYRMGRGIKAGRVWTNCYHLYPAHAAFGGYKKSGVGRYEKILSYLDIAQQDLSYLDIAQQEGAELLAGGSVEKLEGNLASGYYIQPTLLKGHNGMRVFQEEIFGPVVGVTTFKDEAEALAIANDTEYGLGAGLWTRDINRAYRMGRGIKAGRVWTNCYHLYPAHAAFGGYKKSGVGRETHKMMLDHYQQTKNLLVSYDINPLGFF